MTVKILINRRFLICSILTLQILFSITSASTSTSTSTSALTSTSILARRSPEETLEQACRVTRYRQLCMQQLAPFSRVPRQTPYLWARGGVVVTISELKTLSSNLDNIRRNGHLAGKLLAALRDCQEITNAALHCLQDSLQVLRHLNARTFNGQISDVLTWINMAINDENMCINEIVGRGNDVLATVFDMVTNANRVINNALALANHLASSGYSD